MNEILTGIISGGAAGALVIWVGKLWLTERLQQAIRHEYAEQLEHVKAAVRAGELVAQTRWNTKWQACLDALEAVDVVFSRLTWNQPLRVTPQDMDVARARACFNRLILSCENTDVIRTFDRALGLRCPGSDQRPLVTIEALGDLRNAMRKELGFGPPLDLNQGLVWIASLHNRTMPEGGGAVQQADAADKT